MGKPRQWRNRLYVRFQGKLALIELTPSDEKIEYSKLVEQTDKMAVAEFLKCTVDELSFITKEEYEGSILINSCITGGNDKTNDGEMFENLLYVKYGDKAAVVNVGQTRVEIPYATLIANVKLDKLAEFLKCQSDDITFITKDAYDKIRETEYATIYTDPEVINS